MIIFFIETVGQLQAKGVCLAYIIMVALHLFVDISNPKY